MSPSRLTTVLLSALFIAVSGGLSGCADSTVEPSAGDPSPSMSIKIGPPLPPGSAGGSIGCKPPRNPYLRSVSLEFNEGGGSGSFTFWPGTKDLETYRTNLLLRLSGRRYRVGIEVNGDVAEPPLITLNGAESRLDIRVDSITNEKLRFSYGGDLQQEMNSSEYVDIGGGMVVHGEHYPCRHGVLVTS